MTVLNPFTPAFGGKPQNFFGRESELAMVKDALENDFSPYRALFITGNRGCGKTALLEQISEMAERHQWLAVDVHAEDALVGSVKQLIGGLTKTVTREIRPQVAGAAIGGRSTTTTMDYGDTDLFEAIKERLGAINTLQGVLISVDEVQKISEHDAEGLAAAVQMAMRKGYPVMLVMAGLPGAKERIASFEGCTFMERAFEIKLSSLLVDETYEALSGLLALASGLTVDQQAVDRLAKFSLGYPYLMQLVGYYAVREAHEHRPAGVVSLTEGDVALAELPAYAEYCRNVLKAAIRDVRNGSLEYLRAIASLLDGDGKAKTAEVAAFLNREPTQCTSVRQRLIARRLIVPAGHGYVRFNIPYLGRYLLEGEIESEALGESPRAWKF